MKLRIDRRFPYNLITGVLLAREFEFTFPEQRIVITRLKRDPDFIESVNQFYASFPHKDDNPTNYRLLANALNVKIRIRRDDNDVDSYGSGKGPILLYFVDICCHMTFFVYDSGS